MIIVCVSAFILSVAAVVIALCRAAGIMDEKMGTQEWQVKK